MYEDNTSKLIVWILGSAFLMIVFLIVLLFPGVSRAEDIDMSIIKQIESSGNDNAVNKYSGAVGGYQITAICLKDFNQVNKTNYTRKDLFIPYINKQIGTWYMNKRIPQLLKALGLKDTTNNRLISYNAGVNAVKTGIIPTETKDYIRKYTDLRKGI